MIGSNVQVFEAERWDEECIRLGARRLPGSLGDSKAYDLDNPGQMTSWSLI